MHCVGQSKKKDRQDDEPVDCSLVMSRYLYTSSTSRFRCPWLKFSKGDHTVCLNPARPYEPFAAFQNPSRAASRYIENKLIYDSFRENDLVYVALDS